MQQAIDMPVTLKNTTKATRKKSLRTEIIYKYGSGHGQLDHDHGH